MFHGLVELHEPMQFAVVLEVQQRIIEISCVWHGLSA